MKKHILKIGISGIPIENRNLGVAALAYSTLFLLNDLLKELNIQSEITLINSKGDKNDRISISGHEIVFKNTSFNNPISFKGFIKCLLFKDNPFFNGILNLDIILHMIAGDRFSDIYGLDRLKYNLNIIKFFNILNKKQILLPQTIGPFTNKKFEKKAFYLLKQTNIVISRDNQSYNYTSTFLPKEKIEEAIDIAFYLPFEKKVFKNEKINVGVNISGLLWNGGYTRDNQFSLKSDYQNLIKNAITYFAKTHNIQIHLIPHVVPDDNQVEDDYAVCEDIIKEFNQIILPPRFKTPIEAKSYISGLDFFTGARMHACIAAFSTGVPVFPMAYSRKFNGLFAETLQYTWMGDCVNETEEIILNKMKDAFNKRSLLREKINYANVTIVKPRLELLKSILSNNLSK